MSSFFPGLNPLLSDLPLHAHAFAPASPSSTSVSDGSGPEDFDDAIFAETSFQGASSHQVVKPEWRAGGGGGGGAGGSGVGGWKGKEREGSRSRRGGGMDEEEQEEEEVLGVGGDKLPYEIWICIIKLLSSTTDLKSCLLVSHSWCQIGVEILWHKPIFQRVNTLYRLLNVIDPIPVQDETIGAHKARMLLEGGSNSNSRSLTNSPGGGGGNSSMGESTNGDNNASLLLQPQAITTLSVSSTHQPRSGSRSSNNRLLPWDYPTFLIDDPSLLLSSSPTHPPLRTFPYSTFIRRLNLGNISESMSDHSFFRLRTCSRLERLTLQGCSKLSDSVLAAVLGDGNMPELVALDLTNVKLVTDNTVGALARGCPRLQGLNLSGCRLVTDEGVVAVAEGCRLLRRIKLVKCDLITDTSIVALARSCPLLLEVDLVDVPQITSVASRELWLYSSHLRELRLSSCSLLTDTGFPFLFPTATQSHPVTTLAIPLPLPTSSSTNSSNASTPYHTPLHSNAPSPEPTLLGRSSNSNSKILHPPPNWMRQFDHLRILDLTSCSQLTDQAVEAIVSNAPKIRSLVLAKCTGLTDESLASICRFGRSLHQLHMGHVARITDGAVARLARTCTRLRYIDLACCPQLTDMSVFELSQLPKLRRIGLVRVTNLTDNAIHALVERPSSLERIHLSYCENISIEVVHYLLQRLGKLTHLSLTGVPAFRRPDLQKFCRQPPKDFNPHQRQAFCVYSGSGVHDLRRFLATLCDNTSADRAPSSPSSSAVSISFDGDEPITEHTASVAPPQQLPQHHQPQQPIHLLAPSLPPHVNNNNIAAPAPHHLLQGQPWFQSAPLPGPPPPQPPQRQQQQYRTNPTLPPSSSPRRGGPSTLVPSSSSSSTMASPPPAGPLPLPPTHPSSSQHRQTSHSTVSDTFNPVVGSSRPLPARPTGSPASTSEWDRNVAGSSTRPGHARGNGPAAVAEGEGGNGNGGGLGGGRFSFLGGGGGARDRGRSGQGS